MLAELLQSGAHDLVVIFAPGITRYPAAWLGLQGFGFAVCILERSRPLTVCCFKSSACHRPGFSRCFPDFGRVRQRGIVNESDANDGLHGRQNMPWVISFRIGKITHLAAVPGFNPPT